MERTIEKAARVTGSRKRQRLKPKQPKKKFKYNTHHTLSVSNNTQFIFSFEKYKFQK